MRVIAEHNIRTIFACHSTTLITVFEIRLFVGSRDRFSAERRSPVIARLRNEKEDHKGLERRLKIYAHHLLDKGARDPEGRGLLVGTSEQAHCAQHTLRHGPKNRCWMDPLKVVVSVLGYLGCGDGTVEMALLIVLEQGPLLVLFLKLYASMTRSYLLKE